MRKFSLTKIFRSHLDYFSDVSLVRLCREIGDKMRSECSSTLLVEDKKVRVTRFDFEPNQETGWHIHEYDYVITAITDCFMMLQHPDGTETVSEVASGNAYIRDAGVHHNVINTSNQKMSFIEIEFKKSRISK